MPHTADQRSEHRWQDGDVEDRRRDRNYGAGRLPAPCSAAVLPVFEQVLADIGDNQSIEQNLSTFSAHISRLREMALDATPDSLVLLDEIGFVHGSRRRRRARCAGGPLSRGGAFTPASTHLTALKIYGANTKTVLNASMGFDEQTLEPTYQLQVGLPGKSAGLDIAARLGMPEDIMKRARASLSTQEIELTTLIASLHRRLEETQQLQATLERERAALVIREKQIVQEAEKKETANLRELEARFDETRRWQDRGNEQWRVSRRQRKAKAVDEAHRQTARASREMREDWEKIVPQPGEVVAPHKLKIEEGTRVRLKGIREPARVRRLLGGGRFEVEAGFMKMHVSTEDVEEVLPDIIGPSKLPKNVRYQAGPELEPVGAGDSECDWRA